MGILFVNPARRGKKRRHVSGRGKVGRSGSKRSRKRRMPAGLAAYWAKKRKSKRKARRNPAKKRRRGGSHKKRKTVMAKKKRRRARRGKRRTKRRSRRRGRKRAKGGKRRRARRRKSGGKRRRARRKKRSSKRRSRRRGRKRAKGGKRRARRKKGGKRRRRRRASAARTVRMKRGPHGTLIMNPTRRRRRKSRRRGRRRARRAARRYGKRHYRKNPGGMLIDLAKRAAPVLIGLYGARLLVTRVGPKIPGVSKLGSLQSPLLAVGAILAVNFATKKIGKLAKYRTELLLGTGLNALDALISAFAPASVKAMIGVGDVYDRALGEYLHAGAGPYAEDPSRAMGEYVQMGEYVSMGAVDEELGAVDEELGAVDEELGDEGSYGEGVSQSAMLKPVPRVQMLEPVPTRSYLMPIPPATQAYDNPKSLYQGIFAGGAAGSAWDPGE